MTCGSNRRSGSRIFVVLNATRRIGTNTQEIQRALAGSSLQGGGFVDPVTQLPANVADANFGLSDQLFQQERQSMTLQLRGEVDQLSAEPFAERRRRIGATGTNEDDYGATVSWNHDLSEISSVRLRGTMRWQRTQRDRHQLRRDPRHANGSARAGVTFATSLSETVTFSVDYAYSMRHGAGGPTLPYEGKLATAILRKSF